MPADFSHVQRFPAGAVRPGDYRTKGLKDYGTTGLRDYETAHLQPSGFIPHPSVAEDYGTTGQRDYETARVQPSGSPATIQPKAPLPLTPTLSRGRGRHQWPLWEDPVNGQLSPAVESVLPLLGERAGVRGNLSLPHGNGSVASGFVIDFNLEGVRRLRPASSVGGRARTPPSIQGPVATMARSITAHPTPTARSFADSALMAWINIWR